MDKYEFKLKVDEMKALINAHNYKAAAEIAETINWHKVRNLNALVLAGEVFEQVGRYEDSKEILLMAYDKSPIGRNIIYRLAEIAIRTKNFEDAKEYYNEFVDIAPHHNLKFVLKYKMTAAQGLPYKEQIKILEELKEQEYSEEWAYELAYLYHRDGQPDKCVEACDDLILWFGDGIYVEKALELKMHYQQLTKEQEEKYRLFRQKHTGVIEVKPQNFFESGEQAQKKAQPPENGMSIKEIQEEWEKTKQAMQNVLNESKGHSMDPSRKKALSQAEDLIDRLQDIIPKLTAETEIHELLDPEYLQEGGILEQQKDMGVLENIEEAGRIVAIMNQILQEQIDYLSSNTKEESETEADGTQEQEERQAQPDVEENTMKKQMEAGVMKRPAASSELEAKMNEQLELVTRAQPGMNRAQEPQPEPHAEPEKMPEPAPEAETLQQKGILHGKKVEAGKIRISLLGKPKFKTQEQIAAEAAEEAVIEEAVIEEAVIEEAVIEEAVIEEAVIEEAVIEEAVVEKAIIEEAMIEQIEADTAKDITKNITKDIKEAADADDEIEEAAAANNEILEAEPAKDIKEAVTKAAVTEIRKAEKETEIEIEAEEAIEEAVAEEAIEEEPSIKETIEEAAVKESVEEFSEEDMAAAALEAGFSQEPPKQKEPAETVPPDKETRIDDESYKRLTYEQQEIFSYFVPISGMEAQIYDLLQGVSRHLQSDKNSLSGNIIIEGISGSGKTVLNMNIIKALQKECGHPNGRIGKIDANALNQKDTDVLLEKVSGGCLIIESAGRISRETAVKLSLHMEKDRSGTLYILEGTKEDIQKALERDSSFAAKFTEKISIPLFTTDDLVAFGRAYANDLDYDIDEMGTLALHKRIHKMQKLDQVITMTEIKEIVDDAIEKAEKGTFKKVFTILTATRYNDDNYIILREKDFEQ